MAKKNDTENWKVSKLLTIKAYEGLVDVMKKNNMDSITVSEIREIIRRVLLRD